MNGMNALKRNDEAFELMEKYGRIVGIAGRELIK